MKCIQFLPVMMIVTAVSCTKNNDSQSPVGFTVVNALADPDAPALIVNFGTDPVQYFNSANQIFSNSFVQYSPLSGTEPVTVTSAMDTSVSVYTGSLDLRPGKMYTLFLAGADAMHPDTLLSVDEPPYHSSADSVVGIRFVNLLAGNIPISVNLPGGNTGSEITDLSYKEMTSYKIYPATGAISKYTFQITDAAGTVLSGFNYSKIARFKNITIVVTGQSADAASAFLVNDY